jgi:hypothetical protein
VQARRLLFWCRKNFSSFVLQLSTRQVFCRVAATMPRLSQKASIFYCHVFITIGLVILISGGGVAAQQCIPLVSTNPTHPSGCSGIITRFCDYGDDDSYITTSWLRTNASVALCPILVSGRGYSIDNMCRFLLSCSTDSDCNQVSRFPSKERPLCYSSCGRCASPQNFLPIFLFNIPTRLTSCIFSTLAI